MRCVQQNLEVPSHRTTSECSSPGALVNVCDGGNLYAELACGHHPIVDVHSDVTTDKINSGVVLGRALMFDV